MSLAEKFHLSLGVNCSINNSKRNTNVKNNKIEFLLLFFRVKQVKERTFWMKLMVSKVFWLIQEIW